MGRELCEKCGHHSKLPGGRLKRLHGLGAWLCQQCYVAGRALADRADKAAAKKPPSSPDKRRLSRGLADQADKAAPPSSPSKTTHTIKRMAPPSSRGKRRSNVQTADSWHTAFFAHMERRLTQGIPAPMPEASSEKMPGIFVEEPWLTMLLARFKSMELRVWPLGFRGVIGLLDETSMVGIARVTNVVRGLENDAPFRAAFPKHRLQRKRDVPQWSAGQKIFGHMLQDVEPVQPCVPVPACVLPMSRRDTPRMVPIEVPLQRLRLRVASSDTSFASA
jgi:hypothetical protein